jgi:hypothetical protein
MEVLGAIGDVAVCTPNALPRQQHRGASGVCNYGRPAHITGSVDTPSDDLPNLETNQFLSAQELRLRFERAGASRVLLPIAAAELLRDGAGYAWPSDVKLYNG